MTKPNCTITERQDRLLDRMGSERYASRSEALRVAIEDLHQSLENDSQQPIQQLLTDVETVLDTVETVAEEVEELHSGMTVSAGQANPTSTTTDHSTPPTPEVQNNDRNDQLDEQVYAVVSRLELASESEIADQCELGHIRVHESLLRLVDRGLVTSVEDDQTVLYRPAPATE